MAPTTYSFSFADAWAKTTDGQVSVHLLTHCRIAGAVARVLALRDHYSWASGLPILCASHDVGKMSAPFLSQCPSWMSDHGLAQLIDRWRLSKIRHEDFSQATISDILDERGQSLMGARIVGAHHGRWQTSDMGEIDLFEVRQFFKAERRALVDLLESEFGRLPEKAFPQSQARYLAGAVAIADWIASNGEFFPYHDDYPPEACGRLAAEAVTQIGLIPQPFILRLTFEQCFVDIVEPNPLQKAIGELPLDKGLYLLEADTGSGKTEAALYLAYRLISADLAHGLYFALPTQLTSTMILERVQKALLRFSTFQHAVRLCHGNAWLEQPNFQPQFSPGSDPSAADAFRWFSASRRGLLAPFGAGTLDQALLSTLQAVKHSAVRTFGIAGKAVIVDEAHSYDRYTGTLLEKLAEQCRELGSPLIILSATLPTQTRRRLSAIFDSETSGLPQSYPLVTVVGTGEPAAITLSPLKPKTVRIQWTDEQSLIDLAVREAACGQCVLIIRNKVRLAQATYRALREHPGCDGIELGLIHSRFIQADRRRHERNWTRALGAEGPRPRSAILVGTQILEQSLDIDGDLLITGLCPIDLVLQRLGRLWRHQRPRLSDLPTCHVIDSEDEYEKIYSPYLQERTRAVLHAHSRLELPMQTRSLIESVYDDRPETGPEMQRLKAELETQIRTAIDRANRAANERVDYDDEDAQLTRLVSLPTRELIIHDGAEAISGGMRFRFNDRWVEVRDDSVNGAVGRTLHLNAVKVPAYEIADMQPENALGRYFFGGAVAARIDRSSGLLETNTPSPCYCTSEFGFEVRS